MKFEDVQINTFDGVNLRDSPDFADAYVAAASWVATGEELNEDELDDFNDKFRSEIHELIYRHVMEGTII